MGTGALDHFLAKARRRQILAIGLDATVIAATAGIGCAALLLIVGTQILDWYWPVLLFAGSFSYALWRAHRQLPTRYRLAQQIDTRLALQDRLSTAYYFRAQGRDADPRIETVERQALERTSESDLARAVPVRLPKASYAMAATVALALTLFGVRYGILRSLDLRQPMASIDFGLFEQPSQVQAASRKSAVQERFEQQLKQMGLSLDQMDTPLSESEIPSEQAAIASNSTGDNPTPSPQKGKSQMSSDTEQPGGEQTEGGEQSDGASTGASPDGSPGADTGQKPQPGKSQTPPSSANTKASEGGNNSLMDKMRDALANLMQKLKTQQEGPEGQQSASASQGESPGKGQQQASQKGMQGQSRAQGEGEPSPDQQGDQQGEGGDKMQASNDKSGEKGADRPGSPDPKSGMGKQDGNKDIRDAEQLAAMGKISEILGKRAAQVSGEMTVEVPAGKQQLKTSYTQRKAAHADTGSEMTRDEIPLMYQSYIQRYFEEVRKTPPPAAKKN